jgi:hypothetical protein
VDAQTFLQGQFTNDIRQVGPRQQAGGVHHQGSGEQWVVVIGPGWMGSARRAAQPCACTPAR